MTGRSEGEAPKGASESKKVFHKTWWFLLLVILTVVLTAVLLASLYLYNSHSSSGEREGEGRSSGADSSITQGPSSGQNKSSSGEGQKKYEASTTGKESGNTRAANQPALKTALLECARKLSSENSEAVILPNTERVQQSGDEVVVWVKAKMIPNGSAQKSTVYGISKCEFHFDAKTKTFTLKEKGISFELLAKTQWDKWR